MKRSVIMVLVLGLAASGCAQMGGSATRYEVDAVKVARVETNAKQNNIQVIWINYPQRLVPQAVQ